jgi:hypothetical protein
METLYIIRMSSNKHILKNVLLIMICLSWWTATHALDEVRLSTNELVDLAFKDCPELLHYLRSPHVRSSQFEKLRIGEAIGRILVLETPNIPSGTQTSSIFYDTYFPSDISRVLDPGREEQAKLCAIRAFRTISPESIAFTPVLQKLIVQKTLSGNVRIQALEALSEILSKIQGPIDDEIRHMLFRQYEKYTQIINDPVSISLLTYLAKFHTEDLIEFMLKDSRSIPNVMMAISSTDPEGSKSIPLLDKRVTSLKKNISGKVIKSLGWYDTAAAPNIIEFIGNQLPRLPDSAHTETLTVLQKIANTPASYISYYEKQTLPEEILGNYLDFMETADPKHRRIIFKLLSRLRIPETYQTCDITETELPSPLLAKDPSPVFIRTALRRLICPLKDTALLLSWLESEDYAQKVVAIATLGHHDAIDESVTLKIRNLLAKIGRDKRDKELEQLSALAFSYSALAPHNRHMTQLADLAIENLQTSGQLPPVFNDMTDNERHPAISFLLNHGRSALPKVTKLLDHKSSIVRLHVLDILSSPELPYSPAYTPGLLSMLSDPESGLRIQSFDTLMKQIKPTDKKLLLQNLKNEKPFTRFYSATLILEKFISSPEIKTSDRSTQSVNRDALLHAYITALPEIPCQERSRIIPDGLVTLLPELSPKMQKDISKYHLECLTHSQENLEQVSQILAQTPGFHTEAFTQLLDQVQNRKNVIFTYETFRNLANIFLIEERYPKGLEFIEHFLSHAKNLECMLVYKWLKENPAFTIKHPDALEVILKNSYTNKTSSELNKLFLKILNNELKPSTSFTELGKLNLDPGALKNFIALLPRSALYEILHELEKRERFDTYFVFFKSQACHLAPFTDSCKMMFTHSKTAFLDHPDILFSSLLFQIDRYTDYEDCNPDQDFSLTSCEERREAILGEAALLLEKLLISGSWLYIVPTKSTYNTIDRVMHLLNHGTPHHMSTLLHLLHNKLLEKSDFTL